MWKILIFSLLLSSLAQASRARLEALQSNHLQDPEFGYLFPTKMLEIPDYVVLQSGSSLATTIDGRPYLAVKKTFENELSDNYAVTLTLGRPDDLADGARIKFNNLLSTNYELSTNAIDINYAVRHLGTSYALRFFYADQNDKKNQLGNKASTISFGARLDDFSLVTNLGIINQVDDVTSGTQLNIGESISAALVFELDDIHFLLDMSSSRAKRLNAGIETDDYELLNYKMGMVKNYLGGTDIIFYRLNLETILNKNRVTSTNERDVKLPITLGFESQVMEEIKLRGSVQQIVGVYQTEVFEPGPNTTTAAMGVGFTFGKLVIDAVFEGLVGATANQTLNGNQFLTNTSLTYWY